MTLERLTELLAGEPGYRVKQAARAVFGRGVRSLGDVSELPAALRGALAATTVLCFQPDRVLVSKDGTRKAELRLADGKRIESVLMQPKPGLWTACISSQVGCALRCSFCATGLMGFSRNLTAEEITDQVLFWRQVMARERLGKLTNVVYMGMGEPLLNLENVFQSLRTLTDPALFGMGDRHLSVSTAGIAPGIDKFAQAFPQVNLALSLHSADPELRTHLVPINKAYPLQRLIRSLRDYFRLNRRKVFLEYVLLKGENDRPRDARSLARFIEAVGPKHLLHVNLIVFNPTETPHEPTAPEEAKAFARILRDEGVSVTFRKNMGMDIEGACGQLVLKGA